MDAHRTRIALVLALVLPVLTECQRTVAAGARNPRIQAALDSAIDRDVLGAFIRVEDHGEVWEYATGSAVAGTQVPVDPRSRIRIGSITKTFVATLVMQLVDEGKVALDDPAQRHLKVLPADYPPITVRQLLLHTSGIPNYLPFVMETPEHIVADRYRVWSREELLRVAFSQPRSFDPGAETSYSNTNYVLLGLLIESLTGMTWGDAVKHRIAEPLGLTETYAPGNDPVLPEPHAHGYIRLAKDGDSVLVDLTEVSPSSTEAAGSMISSARDLDRFFDALLGGELVSGPSLSEMLRPSGGNVTGLPGVGWGIGILPIELPAECGGETVYGNAGGTIGYTGLAVGTRDRTYSVVFYFNTAGPDYYPPRSEKLLRIGRTAFCARG